MRPICERAKNVQEAKNRCITTYYTAGGRAYQLTGMAAGDNGQNEQLCMSEVERCFNRNRGRDAQNACVNSVVACFNPDTKPPSSAAARLFGASASSAIRGSAKVGVKLMCASLTRDDFMGWNYPVFIPPPKGDVIAGPYLDWGSSVLRCSPRKVFALPLVIAARPFGTVDAGAVGLKLPVMRAKEIVLLQPKTCGLVTIIEPRPPLILKPVPKPVASRGSSGYDGSTSPAGKGNVRNVVTGRPGTASAGSSGFDGSRSDSAINRLTGDGMGGGVSSSYRLPDTALGPRPGGKPGSWGSSGASTVQKPQSSSGFDMSSSGTPVRRQPGGSSGMSFTPGGGATGTFGPRTNSGTIRLNTGPRNIDAFKPPPAPKPCLVSQGCPH